jgi:hypothetical protein
MAVDKALSFQDLSTVQGPLQPKSPVIASAATVSPTTFVTFISGTVAIATVTPPAEGNHMLVFVFTTTTPTAFTTTGNIKYVMTPTQNIPVFLVYDPLLNKYHPGEVVV